jgi:YQGE family putative transporter
MPRGLKALFANYIIVDLAMGLFSVFLPIFLYEFFEKNLQAVFTYYLLGYILTLIVLIFGARKLNKFGFKKALKISTLFSILFYSGLFFLTQENLYYILPIIIAAISIKRLLYWVPYNIDFAKFADSQDRGKTMGLLEILLSITGVITPLVAGFIIAGFGFKYLFLIGIVIFVISYFPLIKLPKTNEKFSWSVRKTIKKIFAKENRTTALVFFAEGAESIVFAVVWPIFVFQILNGNYLQIGLISTVTVVIVIAAQFFVGKKADGTKKSKNKLVKYGGIFYSLAWLLKIFILTALHVFVIDIFHKLTQIFYKIPLNTLVFEKAAGQKHLIDEFIVFREICLNAGRLFMIILILIASFWISLNWLFFFGAIFALFEAFYHRNLYCSLR